MKQPLGISLNVGPGARARIIRLPLGKSLRLPVGVCLDMYVQDSDIDPGDAGLAIAARIKQKVKDRKKIRQTVEEILEDFFIACLINTPIDKWADDTWRAIRDNAIRSNGKFLIRLGSAIEAGHEGIWDDVDIFLLRNQDTGIKLRNKTPLGAVKSLRREGDEARPKRKWVA